jgi:hypothetical protein
LSITDDDLIIINYFISCLEGSETALECVNMAWNCLSILNDKNVWQAVANYLVWFERKSKFKQDVVVMEWYRYTHQGTEKANFFQLPFDGSSTSTNLSFQKLLQSHKLCQSGMQLVMGIGDTRMQRIQQASQVGFIPPQHKGKGKVAHDAIRRNDARLALLKAHFQYMMNLGEVRATRVAATLVDGVAGHSNHDNAEDMVYLPISIGVWMGWDIECGVTQPVYNQEQGSLRG